MCAYRSAVPITLSNFGQVCPSRTWISEERKPPYLILREIDGFIWNVPLHFNHATETWADDTFKMSQHFWKFLSIVEIHSLPYLESPSKIHSNEYKHVQCRFSKSWKIGSGIQTILHHCITGIAEVCYQHYSRILYRIAGKGKSTLFMHLLWYASSLVLQELKRQH